ncbi:MAG: HEAT repeat domain-containing protein, partial [Verrucomicrobiae bacterium]|nr:HEAT repeat domain-containing protein [Verrucomicrobiae bacterium]
MHLTAPKSRSNRGLRLAWGLIIGVATLMMCTPEGRPATGAEGKDNKEDKFLAILRSAETPPEEKALACKQLAIYGSSKSVPSLAEYLSNPQLSSWARIALEAIPDAAADKALRDALPRLEGRLLTGVINSIGNRRDREAVSVLVPYLRHADPEISSAAAAALGRIGGAEAVGALKLALAADQPSLRSAAAEGLVRCAEQFLAADRKSEALAIYDLVRKADVPKQRVAEATRGAILARGDSGVP